MFFRCDRCKEKNRKRCYHWRVGDEDSILQFQEELRKMLEHYCRAFGGDIDEILTKTELIYNPSEVNRFGNKKNIDFDVTNERNSEEDVFFFITLLNKELKLRKLRRHGTVEENRSQLKSHLMIEERLRRLQEAIQRTDEGKEAALLLIKQVVLCIMHAENRVGEKIITVLLSIGAALHQSERASDSLARYAENVEHLVQKRILGTERRPKLWWLPLRENKKEVSSVVEFVFFFFFTQLILLLHNNSQVAKVALSNKKTRQFMNNINLLIDDIFQKPEHIERRNVWKDMLQKYRHAMEILRKQSDYTDDDINLFQDLIDDFFEQYIEVTGVEGITNYLHMLGSGHFKYYMQIHRNLYKFSQQGWESLNSKFKQVFFRHTQRGGHYGRESDENERFYLASVMRAFQREKLWISGDAEHYFESN
jgi:hypothetical protein